MRKNSHVYLALSLMFLLAILHYIANAFYLYWTIWWFDLVMHTLGGFSGALVILWFLKSTNNSRTVLIAVGTLLIVGIVWEIFEYLYDIASASSYWQDTITDLIADGIGAFLACIYAMREPNLKPVSESLDS